MTQELLANHSKFLTRIECVQRHLKEAQELCEGSQIFSSSLVTDTQLDDISAKVEDLLELLGKARQNEIDDFLQKMS